MNSFEKSLQDLLKDCEPLIRVNQNDTVLYKSVIESDSKQKVRQLKDEQRTLSNALHRAYAIIIKLPSYISCQHFFNNDNVFSDAPRLAGFWGTFDALFQDIIFKCGLIRKSNIILNYDIAIERFAEHRRLLKAEDVHFESTARLLGVNLCCKKIILPDRLMLYRLSKKERNAYEQTIKGPFFSDHATSLISFQPTDVRISFNVPLNRSMDNAFFDNNDAAYTITEKAFDNILDAILLAKEGEIGIGPLLVKGGPIKYLKFRSKPIPFINLNVTIRKKDIEDIITAYELITNKSDKIDKIISRSLHRYLIGRKRRDAVDKLIDYVISWESILLTQKGNEIIQELSYRFSINGSSLIAAITKGERKKLFQKMKSIYSLRSRVVHGGGDREIKKELISGEFENLDEACKFLENNFRAAIWWLIGIDKEERPYKKNEGWEELLWPN